MRSLPMRRSCGPSFQACSPLLRYATATVALRLSSPSMCHSKPREISVGGSVKKSLAVVRSTAQRGDASKKQPSTSDAFRIRPPDKTAIWGWIHHTDTEAQRNSISLLCDLCVSVVKSHLPQTNISKKAAAAAVLHVLELKQQAIGIGEVQLGRAAFSAAAVRHPQRDIGFERAG